MVASRIPPRSSWRAALAAACRTSSSEGRCAKALSAIRTASNVAPGTADKSRRSAALNWDRQIPRRGLNARPRHGGLAEVRPSDGVAAHRQPNGLRADSAHGIQNAHRSLATGGFDQRAEHARLARDRGVPVLENQVIVGGEVVVHTDIIATRHDRLTWTSTAGLEFLRHESRTLLRLNTATPSFARQPLAYARGSVPHSFGAGPRGRPVRERMRRLGVSISMVPKRFLTRTTSVPAERRT